MKVAIVHLSDIHISVEKWPDNPVLSRTERIIAAINSLFLNDVTACILLISGDLAYAGLPAEYELASTFFSLIMSGLKSSFGDDKCFAVILPGNHDCNFNKDNDARRHLIADVDAKGFGDGSVANICTVVQEEFFAFCNDFQKRSEPSVGIDRIFVEHRFQFGDEELVFRTLNTAWCSRQNERSGSLFLPAAVLQSRLAPDGKAQLVATALHHPYGWIEPNNARELRKLIEGSSDLVFTGHEHVSESYSKNGYEGEHNEYIEAGPLQENGAPGNSEFTGPELTFLPSINAVGENSLRSGYTNTSSRSTGSLNGWR